MRPRFPEIHVDRDSAGCGEFAAGLVLALLAIVGLGVSTGAIQQIFATLFGL